MRVLVRGRCTFQNTLFVYFSMDDIELPASTPSLPNNAFTNTVRGATPPNQSNVQGKNRGAQVSRAGLQRRP